MRIRFRKTRDRAWLGNGFGHRPAAWEAVDDDTGNVVGTYDADHPTDIGTVFGKRWSGYGYQKWRDAVTSAAKKEI